ncbi:hypothetical protein [Sediminimonas qiaohouensis]|uniref:hypothetical protein n=1 Tax=Sediminimonas qiaohouensis TaxID=552061 RepID=UPI0006854167|nr:hypothetical protein [Sediminimonas qiaohouensis]
MKRTVNVISLWKEMNCTRPIVDQLFADRLLTPIYYGRPGAKGRTQKAVDCGEVAMLVGKLHARAVALVAETDELVPVSKAAEKAKVPAVTVLHMILGGFLDRVFRLVGQNGIAALRVDPVEVKQHSAFCTPGLSPSEAFRALKIPREVGWCLVERCPKEVSLAVNWVACPLGDHRIPRFDPAVVADFKSRFTHPARIAEKFDLQNGEVFGRLIRSGVRPVVTRSDIGVDFYRVSDFGADLFT